MIEVVSARSALSTGDLRVLCIQENWFTGGSLPQCEKMFDMNRCGAPLEDLALVIWLCSPGADRAEVLHKLAEKCEEGNHD